MTEPGTISRGDSIVESPEHLGIARTPHGIAKPDRPTIDHLVCRSDGLFAPPPKFASYSIRPDGTIADRYGAGLPRIGGQPVAFLGLRMDGASCTATAHNTSSGSLYLKLLSTFEDEREVFPLRGGHRDGVLAVDRRHREGVLRRPIAGSAQVTRCAAPEAGGYGLESASLLRLREMLRIRGTNTQPWAAVSRSLWPSPSINDNRPR